jgi:hypothetical protein
MTWITEHWDVLLLVLTNLLALGVAVAKLTPSTTDDEWLAKISEILTNATKK